MATTSGNDIGFLQSTDLGTVSLGAGNDRYVLDAALLSPNQKITISDSGPNTLQLTGGLVITSAQITATAIKLVLNNGAEVTVLGADAFSFLTGGNNAGTGGLSQTFAQFVTTSLGVAAGVPAAGATPVATTAPVTVNATGGTGAVVVPGSTYTLTTPVSSVAEASSVEFTLTASGTSTTDRTFNLVITGDDKNGTVGITKADASDFAANVVKTVVLLAGQTTAKFSMTPVANDGVEGFQGFKVAVLDSSFNAVASSATVVITDTTTDIVAPVVTASTITYAENQVAGAVLGTVAATDAVGVTGFAITSGNAAGLFAIDATGKITQTAAGQSLTAASNDFETAPNAFTLGVTATDAAGNTSAVSNITLNVTDLDDRAPVLTGTVINGTRAVLTYDEALSTATTPAISDFSVGLKGAAGSVAVTGVQVTGNTVVLTLGRAPAPGETFTANYTPGTNKVTDAAGNSVAAIAARDFVGDTTAPTVAAGQSFSYAEDIVTGVTATRTTDSVLGKIATTDDTGVVAYNIVAGNAGGFFKVDGSGNITLTAAGLAGASNDFEVTPNSFVLTVTATDAANNVSATQQVTLNVTNVTTDDAVAPPAAAVITLTAGADNATPTSVVANTKTSTNNDTITGFFDGVVANAATRTITLADAIDGGAGTADKVSVVLTDTNVTAFTNAVAPVLTNVEVLEFRSTGVATNVATLTGFTPNVNTLNFDASSTAATVGGVANAVSTFGLTNTSVTTANTFTVNSAGGLTAAADAATVNLSNNAALAPGGGSGATLALRGSAAGAGYETLNVVSNGGATAMQALTTADSAAATRLTTLNVTGSSNLTINTALDFVAVGARVVATDFSGNLSLSFGATDATVTGGSGNDRFNYSAANFTAADVINAGTGTDTLSLADNVVAAGAVANAINATTSIEVLEQTQVGPTLAANALTSIKSFVFSNAAASATVTGVVNANDFTFTGAAPVTSTFLALTDTAADVLNLTYSNAAGVAVGGNVNAANFETVNLTATSANGAVTNAGNVFNAAAGGTVNLLGAAANTFLLGTGSAINGALATGRLTLTGNAAANTITGGSANDILNGGAGDDTIVGGAGDDRLVGDAGADQLTGGLGNDSFVVADRATTRGTFAATDTTTINIDRITDFVGNGALAGDIIRVIGGGVEFIAAAGSSASVTAFTVANAANFNDLAGALAGIQSSTGALLSVADVTVSAGGLAGRYLIVNDGAAGYQAGAGGDAIIGLTGITGALHAQDFLVV